MVVCVKDWDPLILVKLFVFEAVAALLLERAWGLSSTNSQPARELAC